MSIVKRITDITVAGSFALVCLGAGAQMPTPVPDAQPGKDASRQSDPYAQAVQQMEALLMCKPGTRLDTRAAEARLQAFGLRKGDGGVFLPPAGAPRVQLFGGEVVAALVSDADGEKKLSVYLARPSGKQVAKKLGVTRIDEYANTDEPSYIKETGKKTTLMVGAAAELWAGNAPEAIKYQAMVACQQIR